MLAVVFSRKWGCYLFFRLHSYPISKLSILSMYFKRFIEIWLSHNKLKLLTVDSWRNVDIVSTPENTTTRKQWAHPSPPKASWCPSAIPPSLSPHPYSPFNHPSVSGHCSLVCISRILSKWKCIVCALFCLVSFTEHHYFEIYPS